MANCKMATLGTIYYGNGMAPHGGPCACGPTQPPSNAAPLGLAGPPAAASMEARGADCPAAACRARAGWHGAASLSRGPGLGAPCPVRAGGGPGPRPRRGVGGSVGEGAGPACATPGSGEHACECFPVR